MGLFVDSLFCPHGSRSACGNHFLLVRIMIDPDSLEVEEVLVDQLQCVDGRDIHLHTREVAVRREVYLMVLRSMKRQGMVNPLITCCDIVLIGNNRLLAAKELGYRVVRRIEVPRPDLDLLTVLKSRYESTDAEHENKRFVSFGGAVFRHQGLRERKFQVRFVGEIPASLSSIGRTFHPGKTYTMSYAEWGNLSSRQASFEVLDSET